MIPSLAFLLAVAPGLFAWWQGRRLASSSRDETLPERLFAHRQRVGKAAALGASTMLLAAGAHNAWALPLLVLSLLAGSHPLRKALLEETWDFPAYASHMLRFAAAGLGFFVLLAATPALAQSLGPASITPLAIALVLWAAGSTFVFLLLVRATPLERPDLAPHLDRVIARSGHLAPKVYRAGPRGGRMVNAFAFPGLPKGSVLFTDDLLENFTADEIAAVFAHEVAHLEHYGRKRLLLRGLALLLLITLAAFAVPFLAGFLPEPLQGWAGAAWAMAVALAVPVSMAAHRSHEADSDRRAVALCGDAEALVRALVKLTTLAGLPRRWSLDVERHSSHPSLARRIQAIRQAAGTAPASLSSPVVLKGQEAGRFVVLEQDRAHWLEGAPSDLVAQPEALRLAAGTVRSLPYGDLADLHLEVARGRVTLTARTVSGEKWTLPLQADAAAAAQRALDVVDTRIAPAPASAALPQTLGAVTAAILALSAFLTGHVLLVVPPALTALWRTGPAPLGVAGTVALAAAVLAWWRPSLSAHAPRPLALACLGLAGFVCLLVARVLWKRAPATRQRGAPGILVVQAAVAALGLLPLAWAATVSLPLLRLHQAAAAPLPTAGLLGLGAALLLAAGARARGTGGLSLLVAAGAAFIGSSTFAERYVDDPLLAPARPLRDSSLTLRPLHENRLTGSAGELRISPHGRAFAVRTWGEADEEAASRFLVGALGREVLQIEALDVRFVDEERALVLTYGAGRRLDLRLTRLFAPAEVPSPDPPAERSQGASEWRRPLPELALPRLAVDVPSRRWRLTGTDGNPGAACVFEGSLDGSPPSEGRFALPPGYTPRFVVGLRGGLAHRPRLDPAAPSRAALPLLFAAPLLGFAYPFDTELHLLTGDGPRSLGRSGLEVQCVPPPLEEDAVHCLAFDGSKTTLWAIDPLTGKREARGTVADRLVPWEAAPPGRILAWSASLGSVVLETRGGTVARVEGGGPGATVLAAGHRTLGLLRYDGAGSVVAVYAVD